MSTLVVDFFYAATTISLASWLETKDIEPLIFSISKRRNFMANKGICQDFWDSKINTHEGISQRHIADVVDLWMRVSKV
jgi:hypothetical protein